MQATRAALIGAESPGMVEASKPPGVRGARPTPEHGIAGDGRRV